MFLLKIKTAVTVSVIFLVIDVLSADNCLSRDFGNDGTVCVCNSNHCDSLKPLEVVEQPHYLKYTSNKAGLRFEQEQGSFEDFNDSPNRISIGNESFQEILGFGGAFTDATGINIKSLDEDLQEQILRAYYSAEGIEYSIARVPIGGTDFSTRPYSYCDPDEIDPELTAFRIQSEDHDYKIPLIRRAQDLANEELKLFASAWIAPGWMKTNADITTKSFLRQEMYQPWAHYFLKFLEAYEEHNITFWGITTGNKPMTDSRSSNMPAVEWVPNGLRTWIKENLGPTLRRSPYSNIKIITLEDTRFPLPWVIEMVFAEEAVENYIDGIGIQWYADDTIGPNVLNATYEHYPDKFLLQTEACNGFQPTEPHVLLGSWQRGEAYANSIIEYLNHWAVGWTDWNMVLDVNGGPSYNNNFADAPIIVNSTNGEFYKQPMYYALAHFSKFIPRGSKRLRSSSFDVQVPVAAFLRPDGGVVVNILNKKNTDISTTISDYARGSISLNLTARSITSVVYW